MSTEWVIIVRDKDASVPSAMFRADWASRDHGTGRAEFFKNRQPVGEITLKPSEELIPVVFYL